MQSSRMSKGAKVVVIIVTYNGMQWYKKCFDSIRQSSIPLKTIIIDNKSSDGSVSFIKENYPEIHLVESGENLGFGKANNIGFKYALEQDADFVFLLNQDAWVDQNTIEILVSKMKECPEYGILSPIHLDATRKKVDFNLPYYLRPEFCSDILSDYIVKGKAEDKIYPIHFINAALWLISRKCLEKVGGFDPIFPHYGEDENFSFRVGYHRFRVGLYPHAYGVHDREQSDRAIFNLTYKQKKNKLYISQLVLLTNIQKTFANCVKEWLILLNNIFFTNLLLFRDFRISMHAFIIIIMHFYSIINHRKKAKKGSPFFISDNK